MGLSRQSAGELASKDGRLPAINVGSTNAVFWRTLTSAVSLRIIKPIPQKR